MNTTIKTGLAALLLLAISCKKQNGNLQSSITATDVSEIVTGKYPSVWIGTQKWMTKNLDVTRYRNGEKIPQVNDKAAWAALTTAAWCWYKNDSAVGSVYGKLYNWYAIHDPRGLAPKGWHIPSDAEWDTLSTFLGNNAGGKMKDTGTIEAGTGFWWAPNFGATNSSGFTGLPGGYRSDCCGTWGLIDNSGFWWSSTKDNISYAWCRRLYYQDDAIYRLEYNKHYGFSVRCVKD